jgi:hypothetical protein
MEMSSKTNTDYMLRRALQCSELPSPELLSKISYGTANEEINARHYLPSRRFALAAIVVVMLLTISTVALAYTGVLSDVFLAITSGSHRNNGVASDSRKAIIENEYVAHVTPETPDILDGFSLELKAYYADERELGFNFTLSGPDLPTSWNEVFVRYFSLEITGNDGDINTWELRYIEEINEETSGARGEAITYYVESRTFPGGHYFYDSIHEIHEYEPGDGHDFQVNVSAIEADNGTFDITAIVTFHDLNRDARVPVAEKAHLRIGDFSFLFVDIADYNAVPQATMLNGVWEFDIDIESKFTDATELQYVAAYAKEAERQGITIKSITVLPSICRIEVTLDFSKNGLAHPDNINNELVIEAPWRLAKFDMMDVSVSAVSDSSVYGNMISNYDLDAVNGRIVECWFEISSMFFDAPETLTLIFEGSGGAVIEIPLELAS